MDQFDKDGSAQIDAAELKQLLFYIGERVSDEEVAALIKAADFDGDG